MGPYETRATFPIPKPAVSREIAFRRAVPRDFPGPAGFPPEPHASDQVGFTYLTQMPETLLNSCLIKTSYLVERPFLLFGKTVLITFQLLSPACRGQMPAAAPGENRKLQKIRPKLPAQSVIGFRR